MSSRDSHGIHSRDTVFGPGLMAAGTNVSHGDKWWKSKNCATDNESKLACTICGLKRSYAEVAKQATDQSLKTGADGKQGNPFRQHMEEVASLQR